MQENINLQPYNTMGIEAHARYFLELRETAELQVFLEKKTFWEEEILILGGGSNLLFTKDFSGLVLKNAILGIEKLREDSENVWLRVGAGENWHHFVKYCVENNWGGVENLSLIFGTVGAAPIQNIGAYGVEVKEVIEQVEAFDIHTGKILFFGQNECEFGYRDSIFKRHLKNKVIISHVVFRLAKNPVFRLSYGAIQEILDKKGITKPTIQTISQVVIEIRQSKLPDPAILGNAGSFFKNPEIPNSHSQKLKINFPNIPAYPSEKPEKVKIAAGWLIEQCDWKGKKVGNTGSHALQALVLVNYGGATGREIAALAQAIQKSVLEKFDIHLETEVNII